MIFFFSSRRRHTRLQGDWSSDVCSSDLLTCLSGKTGCGLELSRNGHRPPSASYHSAGTHSGACNPHISALTLPQLRSPPPCIPESNNGTASRVLTIANHF